MYTLYTAREIYSVDDQGHIGRPALKMDPSGQWTILGAVRRNNFGHQVAYIPFPQCADIQDWCHANGKPKWRIRDLDHGTVREWTDAVHFRSRKIEL